MYEISGRIAQFALDAKLPSVSGWSPFARKRSLLTYGPDLRDLYRSLVRYVDRILHGTAPTELPIEIPTKFYLAINRLMLGLCSVLENPGPSRPAPTAARN
jgi:putative ABC transport system substrate-binding protein